MKRILVLGTGFLGTEIKSQLASQYEVFASTRSGRDGTLALEVLKPESFFSIPQDLDHIVYCVSADKGELDSYKNAYLVGVQNVLNYIKDKKIQSFTFVSSTGVYAENRGRLIDETSDIVSSPEEKSKFIVEGENLVLSQDFTLGRVCRLSGIYGPGRDFFIRISEKYSNANYEAPPNYTNRIHKKDAARGIEFLIDRKLGGIWNISDTCPSERLEAMNYIRQYRGLDLIPIGEEYVEAIENGIFQGKKVSSAKLIRAGFEFLYPTYREGYGEMLGTGKI